MLNKLLSLPKSMLAVLVLGGAIVFIVAQDPPHTVCRAQIENFKLQQKGVIYKDPKIKTRQKPLITVMVESCKKHNSPGSCYGLFSRIKRLIYGFKVVAVHCKASFASLGEVRKALFAVYGLMIRIAWGDAPPVAYQDKKNWFSDVDMSVFCLLKERILFFYGKQALINLEKQVFKKLPGAKDLQESRIREMALVSENCSLYPVL